MYVCIVCLLLPTCYQLTDQIDYFERAKRVVEIPLLEKQYEEQIEVDRKLHEELEEEKVMHEAL